MVNCHIAMEDLHFQRENPLFLWLFQIALYVYQEGKQTPGLPGISHVGTVTLLIQAIKMSLGLPQSLIKHMPIGHLSMIVQY